MNVRRVISAFGMGVTLLMITYLLVYLFGGEGAYIREISLLYNYKTLLKEVLWSGIVCVSFTYFVEALKAMKENHDYKIIGVLLFGLVFLTVIIAITSEVNRIYKSETIEDWYYGLVIVGFMLDTITSMIGFKLEEETLNQKLKERNQNK